MYTIPTYANRYYQSQASGLVPLADHRDEEEKITIPAPICEALGIKEGDTISVSLEGDEVKLEPVSLSLAESYRSVPALSAPHSWKEVLEIAHEDHAEEVIKEG